MLEAGELHREAFFEMAHHPARNWPGTAPARLSVPARQGRGFCPVQGQPAGRIAQRRDKGETEGRAMKHPTSQNGTTAGC